MASHDYLIQIGGTLLSTISTNSRFVKWTTGTRRGDDVVIPYAHGEYAILDSYFTGANVLLEIFVGFTTTATAKKTLSDVAKLLSAQSLVDVEQNDPHMGDVQARVKQVTDPIEGGDGTVWLFGLRNPKGFWEDVTPSTAASANPPVVSTGGDRPIDDMILTAAGTGFLQHTDALGQLSRITIDSGAGGTTPYIVDVGLGTVKDSAGSPVNKDEFLTVTQPWWMKWDAEGSQSFTSDVAWAASWRDKWA